jgi:D-alanine-D-alanine ligase
VRQRLTIVFNQPHKSRYDASHEEKAVYGVLEAVAAVRQSLEELDYAVTLLPLVPPLETVKKSLLMMVDTDLVFNLFEGFPGEPESEALVPEFLTKRQLPFTGCRADVLRLALDKVNVKVLLRAAGIPTPDFQVLNPRTLETFHLGFPCIVKPRRDDASHGITDKSVVYNRADLGKQVAGLSEKYYSGVLAERFLTGREFNATVLGKDTGTVLPVSEIVYALPPGKPRLLTFVAKWEPDSPEYRGTRAVCPADVSAEENERISSLALRVFQKLGGRGYARVDMRRDEKGELNVIEINPNPDISPGTGAAIQAGAAGMSYTDFVDAIVRLELESEVYAR